ncbi:hypothetical protein VFPFJ_02091 [Purpureocillium lilacinum]|uniref:Uncharacterized protein n=1 Tax=Purpureocillium lilacinum TaxID=33203 RepID=A0A179HU57_PURLI|nr:hypothetical protein VFPFJ_02091 [Purpureocillium lilacinum]OAQ92930.1 hypothetical protein VFPFJ_02091 [Purpureocillium lilacinum]
MSPKAVRCEPPRQSQCERPGVGDAPSEAGRQYASHRIDSDSGTGGSRRGCRCRECNEHGRGNEET